jgi:hypothetical protein
VNLLRILGLLFIKLLQVKLLFVLNFPFLGFQDLLHLVLGVKAVLVVCLPN